MNDGFVGHYRILKSLGEGAMGKVYLGLDEKLDMKVAIKVLSPSIAGDIQNVARFEREARAAAGLRHPNIAHVFYVGRTDDDLPFYAMEFIEGFELSDVIRKRMRFSGAQLVAIMQQICAALQFAADKGVLHRDVKPGNVMIEDGGGAKLVDFGLAKIIATDSDSDHNLTGTGVALGTPNYISPEQARGERVDWRSDMYSLGVTFFELLTGTLPYTSETALGVIMKHVREPVPDPCDVSALYPRSLGHIIQRMMAKDPDERFGSYNEVIVELNKVAATETAFVQASWTFCEICGFTSRLKEERQCAVCATDLQPAPQEEVFVSVNLVGFNRPDALEKVLAYLVQTTGRPATELASRLERLPMVLNNRSPMDKAKRIRAKMYEIGAVVELPRVETRSSAVGGRPSLSLSMSPGLTVVTELSRARGPLGATLPRTWFVVAVAVAVILALVVGFMALKLHEMDQAINTIGATETRSPAKSAASRKSTKTKTAPVATASPAPARTPSAAAETPADDADTKPAEELAVVTSNEGNFKLTGVGGVETSLMRDLALMAEEDLLRIRMRTGVTPSKPISIRVDGREPFSLQKPTLGMATAVGGGSAVLYAQGLTSATPSARATLIAMTARALIIQEGGEKLPLWLADGFALAMVRLVAPDSYDPDRFLRPLAHYLDDELWEEGFRNKDTMAYAQAASFVGYLLDHFNPESVLAIARHVREHDDIAAAFADVVKQDRMQIMDAWFAQRSR